MIVAPRFFMRHAKAHDNFFGKPRRACATLNAARIYIFFSG